MTEATENIMLEILKNLRTEIRDFRTNQELANADIRSRMNNLEHGQASLLKYVGHLASVDAQLQLGSDNFNARLERIERRLDLIQ